MIFRGKIKTIDFLINYSKKLNLKDFSAETFLYRAVSYGKTNVVKYLLSIKGIKANNNGNFNINNAYNNKYFDIVELLWQKKRSSNYCKK